MRIILLLCFIGSGISQAGIVVTGDMSPASRFHAIFDGREPIELKLRVLSSQQAISRMIAQQNAMAADVCRGLCAYHAVAFFQQAETDRLIDEDAIRFIGNKTSLENMSLALSQVLDRTMLIHHDINFNHQAQSLTQWLRENLLNDEPVLLSAYIIPQGSHADRRHALNAIKIDDQVYIYDSGHNVTGIKAEDFFNRGVSAYRVNLNRRVAVIRVLRRHVRYQFNPIEISAQSLSVNGYRLDLRAYSQARIERGVTYRDLHAESQRSAQISNLCH